MAKVCFEYNGIKTFIQCSKEEKMSNICIKYAVKIQKNINSLYFLYNGIKINNELTFYEQANSFDKNRLEMNILAISTDDEANPLQCPKCGCNLDNIKIFSDLMKCNKKLNNMLNELKSQIELININEIDKIENKIKLIKYLVNDIISENEKNKIEIQNILNKNKNEINKDEKFKYLEKELNNMKINESTKENSYNSYDNFDIKQKKCIHLFKEHSNTVYCSTILYDGRIATSSGDKSIIIYNKNTFKPDIKIKEHDGPVGYILQLSSGMLASCSVDTTIKIFIIKDNNYQVFQTLKYHIDWVNKIIELNSKKLVSCSSDCSFIVYSIDSNKYYKDYQVVIDNKSFCIIETKKNEICYNGRNSIYFYDLLKKKTICKINDIKNIGWNSFNMITKDLLLITGYELLYVVNVNNYSLSRTISVGYSGYICISCMLNKNILLTGDEKRRIIQWKIEGDNLKLLSIKENVHSSDVCALLKLGNEQILSGSRDGEIKIWK